MMRKTIALPFAFAILASLAHAQTAVPSTHAPSEMDHAAHMQLMADANRQAAVSALGKDVMPFSLPATTHIFIKSADGGVQRVVTKKTSDKEQEILVRRHLKEIREQFLQGDFSGPIHIHGQDMPGLSELKAAKPGQITISYKDIKGGAQLTYTTADAALVAALHNWYDAQLTDHGKDAKAGHANHKNMMK